MDNVVRKAIRLEIKRIMQLRDFVESKGGQMEANELNQALIYLCRADYWDFHRNPNKRYKEPKSDFKFIEK